MHINVALEEFLLQLQADGRSPHTVDQYRRHVGSLAAWLAPVDDTDQVDHQTLARFLVSPVARTRPDGRPRKASVMNALRSSLRGFFSYLATSGSLERDPSRLIRRARCGPPPPRTLSKEDQERLLDVLREADGGRDFALFSTMLGTGIRVGSAVALDVEDVDLGRGELWLRRTKGDRPERVFLPREVVGILRGYLAGRSSGPLFPGQRGQRITTRHVGRRLKGWLDGAGIDRPASPHSLRHTFATDLYRRTGDVLLVKEALRHRSVASTLVYAQGDPERVRAALG